MYIFKSRTDQSAEYIGKEHLQEKTVDLPCFSTTFYIQFFDR